MQLHCLVLTNLLQCSLYTPQQICLHICPRGLVTVCPIFRNKADRVAKDYSVLLSFKAIFRDFPPKKSYEEKEENIKSKQIKFLNEQGHQELSGKSDGNKSFKPNQIAPSIYIMIELCFFSLDQ